MEHGVSYFLVVALLVALFASFLFLLVPCMKGLWGSFKTLTATFSQAPIVYRIECNLAEVEGEVQFLVGAFMNVEELKATLTKEGYREIYTWEDPPRTVYPLHSHSQTKLYIVTGSITFTINKEEIILRSGDSIIVKDGQLHSALVGQEGCSYVVGEM